MDANSLEYSLDPVLPRLGSVLKTLFGEERKKKPGAIPCQRLLQEMPGDPDTQKATLVGALAILRGMGLICVDAHGRVKGISRHARFALGSLGEFLNASVPAADERVDNRERTYLISLTKALESARVEKAQVDKEPLHSRRIVNVLIKGRQIRHWKSQDVYLHVYHPQWKQYHLVGFSHKDDSKTDQEIAQLALQQQVGLMPHQYTLDPVFNPPEETIRRISATSGALTEYTYRLMAVKEIRVKELRLQRSIEKEKLDQNRFRWFTWEEIKREESEQGEPIMFSTPIIMGKVDLSSIPISVPRADDVRRPVGVFNELSYRFTRQQLLAFAGIPFTLSLIWFSPHIFALLDCSSPLLDNLANIAEFGTAVISLGLAVMGALVALFKKS